MEAIVNLSGYQIAEQVYAGTRTLVYRAIRTSDQYPVVIKLLRNEYPNFHELVGFRNQYTTAKNLDFPTIIKPLSLEAYHNSYALVMEDFGGISLSTYLKTAATDEKQPSKSLSLTEFLNLALQLCDILDYLSQNRVIHKDIKPANILIHPQTKQIKLIDFSISSLLPRETQEIQNPNVLEGTLAYLSPEQTGRMNRGIDYRSDFYSLGVTFYELLTGQLPFVSDDPMELVHCHLAKQSIPIHQINPEIPLALSGIVSKLMAKNAEKRYQSALGLKHDLENCLTQLQATGKIADFELGKRDITDRFLIPEKLYGRETEVAQLLAAFERVASGRCPQLPLINEASEDSPLCRGGAPVGALGGGESHLSGSEMMLVAGFSGIGKTAVVNEVHKPIVRQRGYFIKGKYDQFGRNIPFSAFVQAFRDLIGQLLSESDAGLQIWKTKILTAVGDSGQVLIDVIPELELIIGKQPAAAELSGSAAQNRFNLLMQKFVQVFTAAEHPLVMFLDDLQWADSASLKLLQLLMAETGHLLILGAYRDNEVSRVHPFILTVDEIVKTKAAVNTITLQPLSLADMNQLVADTLNCDRTFAQPLTELVYQKTKGNPFFATQFLKALYEDGQINFNPAHSPLTKGGNKRGWQCNITQVKALAITDDVVEFMAMQLQKLPAQTQDVLKLAACIGAQFDLQTLAIVSEKSLEATAADLWKALQESLIIPNTEIYKFFMQSDSALADDAAANPIYRFLHDRIQQAAYSLISEQEKQATHYNIGKLLLDNSSDSEREERLFEIVAHLNAGKIAIGRDLKAEELAQLNLMAGRKAQAATAYAAAIQYLSTGIELLAVNSWHTQYQLTLELYVAATQAAYLNTEFEQVEKLAEIVLEFTSILLDRIKIYEIKIQVLIAQNKLIEAIELGLKVLGLLGIKFPEQPNQSDIIDGLQKTQLLWNDIKVTEVVDLPLMTDPDKLAAMQILLNISAVSYIAAPPLYLLIVFQQVNLSVKYGNTAASTYSYAAYGLILCGVVGDMALGYQFGHVALNLLHKLNAKELQSKIYVIVNCFIQHWQNHLRTTIQPLQDSYLIGLEIGDLEFAGYSAFKKTVYLYFSGEELSNVEQDITLFMAGVKKIKNNTLVNYYQVVQQVVNQLKSYPNKSQSRTENRVKLEKPEATQDANGICYFHCHKMILYYLFGDYSQAIASANFAEKYLEAMTALFFIPVFYFYDSLTRLAVCADATRSEQENMLAKVTENQQKMQKWADSAPMNHLHKFELVEAEKCRVTGNKAEAIALYDRAIALAKENQYLQEEALANELAAKFYLDWGKEKVAGAYAIEAYYCYTRWGALAKVDDLQTRYPQLLGPILQQAKSSFNVLETLTTLTHSSTQVSSTGSSISDALDFASVLKAAQALSSEIQLDELVKQLVQIVLQNSGANRCVLVLPQDGTWLVRAISTPEATELCSEPLDDRPDVPLKLIQYVKRTRSAVAIDNLQTDLPVIDDYLIQRQPKSILCLPILDRGHLAGILYLKNQMTCGVFTSERISVIEFLCAQAAISLENARLYTNVQASEARFQRLAENVPGAIYQFQLSPSGKPSFTYINPVCYELYELSPAEIVNDAQVLISRIHADDMERFQESVAISAQTLTPWHFQGRFFTASGILKWVQGDSRPIKQADGTIVWDGILMDISDRKRAEVAITQKSQELSQALQNLQETQLQMIQSEKMSALGNLVAGVAHEINNPVGFISGNLHETQQTVQDLVEHLNLYRSRAPETDIADHAEDIDLDYIIEDLPKMIDSMKLGCDRIKGISTSLRTFSRADTDYPVAYNIHDGIDSTLMILKHRLKANESRPEIAVIKDYGDLPQLECYPGQLNQVFMNLLANAIDALDESNQGMSYQNIANQITIKTELYADIKQAIIRIKDNGVGMTEAVRVKIFDELFTTKEVGKGTGLGLAIARQIVVEKHGGTIEVNSVLGEGTEFTILLPMKG
ncbi:MULTISPECIES: AAA family ATPase [unclassified Microcoleus]|uniref:AAA family ATPase n=1 Tax=unclassified Microcoleus TaxID=2642155 RepID=UPI002FD14C57